MKKTLSLLIVLCFCVVSFAQHSYTLRIFSTKAKPMGGVEVTAKTTEGSVVLKSTTDNNGKAIFDLNEPGVYKFSYLNQKDVASYTIKEGTSGNGSKTTTYDPDGYFAVAAVESRSGISFKSANALQNKGQQNMAKVNVEIKRQTGGHWSDLPIEVIDIKGKTKYKGTTNSTGYATFYLPINRDYEIDIANIEAINTFNVPNYPNSTMSVWSYYEKTFVDESTQSDTIKQNNITQETGTSTHILYTLTLTNYDGEPLANEIVALDDENSSTVYFGTTNTEGICKFMLKKGTSYLVNLKYDRGIDLIDASRSDGFASSWSHRRYRGSAAIERMMAERKTNTEGFVISHEETPIKRATTPLDYLTKTTNGFNIDFETSGPIGTPTIVEDKILTQEGFYSPNFYCLDAITGKYLWGIELGESGMSPIVSQDEVLLINTYSCTLYAIDINNGNMLWSKWLAGTIYSTPSTDNSSVYVVYDNGYNNPVNSSETFVISSFDLRTGEVNWMKWIDDEVIACPVVDGSEVHVASQSGNYYVFDKESGNQTLMSTEIKAVSSPTLTENNIFITATVNGKEKLVSLNRENLKIQKTFRPNLNPQKIKRQTECYNQMNFNGAHPIVYKNQTVIITDSAKIYAFDTQTESIIWQKFVKIHPNQIPIVANEQVHIATVTGEVISYDIKTGVPQKIKYSDNEIDGQLLTYKGFLFVATAGILQVIKSNKDLKHEQWNGSGGHNTVFE